MNPASPSSPPHGTEAARDATDSSAPADSAGTTPVGAALQALGVAHRAFRHAEPPRSLEEAAAGRGHRPEQVVRSILFRLSQDDYALVLVAGSGQLPWKALRRILGQSRIRMATPEEVLAVTGYPVGAVAPFGMPGRPRILLDASVLAEAEVSMGSGVRGTAIILRSDDLSAALGPVERVELAKEAG